LKCAYDNSWEIDFPQEIQWGAALSLTAIVDRDVSMTCRDGITLKSTVLRPNDDQRHPVLLQRTPYGKDDAYVSIWHAGLDPLDAVSRGFVVIIQDVRGRFASEGVFAPFVNESKDGYDTVRWAAEQSWSNGRVCMYGVSYSGMTQILALAARPPALVALAAHETSGDAFEGWTSRSGARQYGFLLWWALSLARVELVRNYADPQYLGLLEEIDFLLAHPEDAFTINSNRATEAINKILPSYGDWLDHPTRDGFWRPLGVFDALISDKGVPALHIAGWNDIFLDASIELWRRMEESAGTNSQRLVIGPWAHGLPLDTIGVSNFGPQASQAAIELTRLQLDFFEAVIASGLPPTNTSPVTYFAMGPNTWEASGSWPPESATEKEFFLRGNGGLNEVPPLADESSRNFEFDPLRPVPTMGGGTFLPGLFVGRNVGPQVQNPLRGDVLSYLSQPLPKAVIITGATSAVLWITTNVVSTDFTAKIIDVAADGRSINITDGIRRIMETRDQDLTTPTLVEIEMGNTAYKVEAGHQLRLDISSSNYPRFDINPNSGKSSKLSDHGQVAHQVVLSDTNFPSILRLMVKEIS